VFSFSNLYKLIFTLFISISLHGQECSPYRTPKNYILDKNKSGAIGYVACLHARGVVAEVGYNDVFVGVLAMGKGHHGATYSFVQYEFAIRELRIYGGPAYRLNNNPSLITGRIGADLKIYKRIWTTASILQINRNLNYLHIGIKTVL
jgi:hypothetical protein